MPQLTDIALRHWLHDYIAAHLKKPASSIDYTKSFVELGLDSVEVVIAGAHLEDHFQIEIDATMFLRNRTCEEVIADMVQSVMAQRQP